MGLFTDNFNAGVVGGTTLANAFGKTRDRRELRGLAEQFGQNKNYEALGTGLLGLGQVGAGLRATQVPYQQQQQALQREFQNQQAQSLNLHRDRTFENTQSQQDFNNDLAIRRQQMLEEEAARKLDPNNPLNRPKVFTPVKGFDENGNPAFGFPDDSGVINVVDNFTPIGGTVTIRRGNHDEIIDKTTGEVIKRVEIDNFTPAFDKARGGSQGKAQVEKDSSFNSLNSKMAGLKTVVSKLDELSEKATFTFAGQARDEALRQAGLNPTEGGIARTEYIAIVDNQILPLLRDTFGAAFTVKEGETLRATLGAPNKSPKEKQAVLKAFIEQKERDLNAMRLPQETSNGLSFSRDSRVTPASGDTVPINDEELNDLLGRY